MLVPVYSVSGEVVGEAELPESVFGVEPSMALMHQALVRQLANARRGTHATKNRSEVSGGGRKPWRQKGLGRARHGSIRSPIWRGGGVAFGPSPRSYVQKMPKKMRRAAVRSALSVKAREGSVVLVDGLSLQAPRTKEMARVLDNLQVREKSCLMGLVTRDENVYRAARNLPGVKAIQVQYLNVRDLLQYEKLVLPVEALEIIEGWLASGAALTEAQE